MRLKYSLSCFCFRVLKTRGLRVIDTSVLRVNTNANLNAPAIMLGEKGSDMIREYWSQQYVVCVAFNYYFLYESEQQKCFYTQMP